MSTRLPPGRVLPPMPKKLIEQTYQQRFTWKQRLQILFGYHAVIKFTMRTEHGPGRIEAKCDVQVTGDL